MDLLSSLSSRGQPNWLQATVSTVSQNLIPTDFNVPSTSLYLEGDKN